MGLAISFPKEICGWAGSFCLQTGLGQWPQRRGCDKEKFPPSLWEAGVRATGPGSLRADIPASSHGELLVFLSWRPPGTSPHSSKLYLHGLVEDGLGMSIASTGQRDHSMESSSHHPLQVPSGAKILGQGITLARTMAFCSKHLWAEIPAG